MFSGDKNITAYQLTLINNFLCPDNNPWDFQIDSNWKLNISDIEKYQVNQLEESMENVWKTATICFVEHRKSHGRIFPSW